MPPAPGPSALHLLRCLEGGRIEPPPGHRQRGPLSVDPLHAQAHLEAWYTGLGWTRVGEVYEEAEIPHVTMTRGV